MTVESVIQDEVAPPAVNGSVAFVRCDGEASAPPTPVLGDDTT